MIILLGKQVLAGTRGIFVLKVVVKLAFSVEGGSKSQVREIISWEGSIW
jgi:hypothetical protein